MKPSKAYNDDPLSCEVHVSETELLARDGDVAGGASLDHARRGEQAPPAASEAAAATTTTTPKLSIAQSLGLVAIYVFASIFYFLCIRVSKQRGTYNAAFLVLLIEFTKLCVSVGLRYAQDRECLLYTVFLSRQRREVWRNGLPYAVPSLLYALYNNLTFVNLAQVDPGSYQVYMQTRILFTGILYTIVLRQNLSLRHWYALVLLMVGVMAKYITSSTALQLLNRSIVFILFQAILSSLAGVFNELVLKQHAHLSIHQQNFFMYFYALFFNVAIGLISNKEYYMNVTWSSLCQPIYLWIVLFGAMTGLAAAFILKFINVIVKAFGSAVEVILTAVMAAVLLGEPLTLRDLVATALVTFAVYTFYSVGYGSSTYIRCPRGRAVA